MLLVLLWSSSSGPWAQSGCVKRVAPLSPPGGEAVQLQRTAPAVPFAPAVDLPEPYLKKKTNQSTNTKKYVCDIII